MTTNKPGCVSQPPLFGCVSCNEYQTYPADHLRVYGGYCYCNECWDVYQNDAGKEWHDLKPFVPALQAECEKLRKDAARWRETRKSGDSVRVVFTDWDAMKDYVLSNEEADAAIDAAMELAK